jgi:5-methylthioribose kinase
MAVLDIEDFGSLADYLHRRELAPEGAIASVRALPGGVSNRTVLVRFTDGRGWVLKQALAKLRVKVDWFSDPERAHREALALDWYARLAPPGAVPRLVFEDREQHLLAMEAVPLPHWNWKSLLLDGELKLEHVKQFGKLLGTVHRRAAAQPELREAFADTSFFESLRLEPYYLYSASEVPRAGEFLRRLVADTRSRPITLVHGDYSPKNVLVHRDRLVLLDYEVAHFGDPAFDLGFSLAHLCSKAHHLADQRSAFAEAANVYWRTYRTTIAPDSEAPQDAAWQGELEPRAVRHALGCLLARVAGRSPLEYLSATERERQQSAVVAMMAAPPLTVSDLVREFVARLES